MELDLNLIGNFLVAIFIYNIIIEAFAATVMKWLLKSDVAKEIKKDFRELLREKLKEKEDEQKTI
jgi:hypothetical protein